MRNDKRDFSRGVKEIIGLFVLSVIMYYYSPILFTGTRGEIKNCFLSLLLFVVELNVQC